MLIRHLRHIIRTKGTLHAGERLGEVAWRFFAGRRRFRRRLDAFQETFVDQGIRVTFCVTATLLSRHRDLVERLRDQGHEIAAHGHVHTRMDQYSRLEQDRLIQESFAAFREAGLQPAGFRCPYLNFNDDTTAGLRASPYRWTSGEMVWWNDGCPVKDEVARLDDLYHFIQKSGAPVLPRLDGALVHIPITAPDDELLCERQRVRKAEDLAEIWWKVFEGHHQEGGLHHQFFHPERFDWIRPALEQVISRVSRLGDEVWKPTLTELADWWRKTGYLKVGERPANGGPAVQWPGGARSCFVISADICAFDLRDFLDRAKRF